MLSGAGGPQLIVAVAAAFGPFPGDEELEVGGQKVLLLVAPQTVSAMDPRLVSADGSPNPEGVMDGRIFRPNLPLMSTQSSKAGPPAPCAYSFGGTESPVPTSCRSGVTKRDGHNGRTTVQTPSN